MSLKSFLSLLLAGTLLFTINACTEIVQEDPAATSGGEIQFALSTGGQNLNKTTGDSIPVSALVTLVNSENVTIVKLTRIDLVRFGSGLISKPLEITPSTCKLTEFIVLNSQGEAIYATPVSESDYAPLVKNPLPISIIVEKDQVVTQPVEVISVQGSEPKDFGYISFSFGIVTTQTIMISPMIQNQTTGYFEFTYGSVEIWVNNQSYLNKNLDAKVNSIVINKFSETDTIDLVFTKEGFVSTTQRFNGKSISALSNSPLLYIFKQSISGEDSTSSVFKYQNLVLGLAFDRSTDDFSLNQQEIKTHGQVSYVSDRKNGQAIHFNGSEYLTVTNTASLNPSSFTLSAWVYMEEDYPIIGNTPIFEKPNQTHSGPLYQYHLGIAAGWYHTFGVTMGNTEMQIIGTPFDIWHTGAWYHVVGVFNDAADVFSVYVNGIKQASQTITQPSTDLGRDIYIGRFGNLDYFFMGTLDDIRIYNVPFSDSEVMELYTE